jgi:multisubunit Na+/H+ antiporter MnhF subunit
VDSRPTAAQRPGATSLSHEEPDGTMNGLHPLASDHLRASFVMVVVLLAAVLITGNLYFKIHSLPERIAHRGNKIQFQIVAVLCLLALFTHNHLFWIVALLLALVQVPDFSSSLARIADALESLARSGAPRPTRTARPADEPTGEGS